VKTSFFRQIRRRRVARRVVTPTQGYDLWAATYDTQPNNAVLELESRLFRELLSRVSFEAKVIVDIGCGTGRHWPEILSQRPSQLIGVDPSKRMLERLSQRYPDRPVICTLGDCLTALPDESSDAIVSTLAMAHIVDTSGAIREWQRILRTGGIVLLTDFHPDASRAGMKRTFVSSGETVEIEQHSVSLDELRALAEHYKLQVAFAAERAIDESVRPLFEQAGALTRFDKHKGLQLIFGMHLVKT
jgi:ubiquinone/menaquinone biosynthesis C-methylase UbiE